MSVCPFCKAQVTSSTAPCPRCGKLASEHPSIAAISGRTLSTDFDDDDQGELSLEEGASAGHASSPGVSAPYDTGKGVTLDDDLFGDDGHDGPLELDVPDLPDAPISSRKPPAPTSEPRVGSPAAPPAATSSSRLPAAAPVGPASSGKMGVSSGAPPAPASSSGRFAVAPDSSPDANAAHEPPPPPAPPSPTDQAAVRIANFPAPPEKVWQAPRYALQVLYRKFELKQDLESLKRKRSPDVGLYERALRSHDPKMYTTGLAITGIAIFVATVLFFMPVIKRFAFAPD